MEKERGAILVLAMLVMTLLLLFGGVMLQLTVINLMMLEKQSGVDRAYWIALAGINQQRHDLKEYYFQHQMEYVEKEFAGGKYKVGTATLIGQGVHRSIIVATGEYNEHKKCIYAQIGMNTSTDYLYFYEGPTYDFRNHNSAPSPIFSGPVHINGDCVVGHGGTNVIFIKSDSDYGPVFSASGVIYSANGAFPFWKGSMWCVYGEGKMQKPFTFNSSNIPSNFTNAVYSAKGGGVGHIWPGDWYTWDKPYPYNSKAFPSRVNHVGPDGKEYFYDLVQHSENNGTYIKIPTTMNINYNKFRTVIDDKFYINSFAWENPAAKKISVTNECRNFTPNDAGSPRRIYLGASLEKVGNLNFTGSNNDFYINLEKGRTPQFVKHIFLKNDEVSFNSMYPMPIDYYRMRNGTAVTTDLANSRLVFTYSKGSSYINYGTAKGIEWLGHFFSQDPIGGKWYGRRMGYTLNQTAPGTASWSVNINDDNWPRWGVDFKYPLVVNVPATDNHAENIFVDGTKWERAGLIYNGSPAYGTVLSNYTGSMNRYVLDYYTGDIYFGDGTNGNIPPLGAVITTNWSHPFSTPFEVWLNEAIDCVFIDLDKIDEENCPRDPSYPDDKTKFGVIYSTVPLYVMGVPNVPVTIVCEDDVYLGPINTSYLNWNLELEKPSRDFEEDDDNLCPVGIITKRVLYFDYTFAPQVPAPTKGSSVRIYNNSWISIDDYTQLDKVLKLNKVAVYHPLIRDVTVPFLNRPDFLRNYFIDMGKMIVGGIKRGMNAPPRGAASGGTSSDNAIKFIGSLYQCYDRNLSNYAYAGDTSRPPIQVRWEGDKEYVYTSSFRYWKKDKALTSGPPLHMPVDIRGEWWLGGNPTIAEKFFTELQKILNENLDYTPELSYAINELLTTVEK